MVIFNNRRGKKVFCFSMDESFLIFIADIRIGVCMNLSLTLGYPDAVAGHQISS